MATLMLALPSQVKEWMLCCGLVPRPEVMGGGGSHRSAAELKGEEWHSAGHLPIPWGAVKEAS